MLRPRPCPECARYSTCEGPDSETCPNRAWLNQDYVGCKHKLVERVDIEACEWQEIECVGTVMAILRMRLNDGISQAEVARRLKIDRSFVCRTEQKYKEILKKALMEKILNVA